jgi:hypothetical protein
MSLHFGVGDPAESLFNWRVYDTYPVGWEVPEYGRELCQG